MFHLLFLSDNTQVFRVMKESPEDLCSALSLGCFSIYYHFVQTLYSCSPLSTTTYLV